MTASPMTAARRAAGQGPRRSPDRPRRARRAVPAVAGRRRRRRASLGLPVTGSRSACSACSGCRSARSSRTTRSTSTRRTAASPGCCAWSARRPATSGRSWSSTPIGQGRCRRHPLPARPAPPARRRQARRDPLPRRLRRRRRQRRAVHAGRLRALRRGAHPPSARRPGAARADGRRGGRRLRHPADAAARRARPQPAVRRGDAAAGRSAWRRIRLPDWERQGTHWRIPRSSLDAHPALRRHRGLRPGCRPAAAGRTSSPRFVQVGVAKEDQPHYLRVLGRPDHDPTALIAFGLGRSIAAAHGQRRRPSARPRGHRAVRTYESPLDRRLEDAGFDAVATRVPADEGDARARRRAGPGAGATR